MKRLGIVFAAIAGWCAGYFGATHWSRQSVGDSPANALPSASQPAAQGNAPAGSRMSEAATKALLSLQAPKSLEDYANARELLARIELRDFPLLMEAITRMPVKKRKELMVLVFQAWAARDPAAAKAWGESIMAQVAADGLSHYGESAVRGVAEEWFRLFPEATLDFAHKHWPNAGGTQALHNAITAARRGGHAGMFSTVQSFPAGKERQKSLTTLFHQWVQYDREAALAAARTLTGSERENAVSQVIVMQGQRDPMRAFTLAREEGLADPALLTALGSEAGVSKGSETAKWLVENAPEFIPIAGPDLVARWAGRDPVAAFSWALENGISLTTSRTDFDLSPRGKDWTANMGGGGYGPLIDEAIVNKPKETLDWIRSLPQGKERDELLYAALISSHAKADSFSIFADLPDGMKQSAVVYVVRTNFTNQGDKAREWVATLPTGPLQDSAWRAIGASSQVPADFPDARVRDLMLEGAATLSFGDAEKRLASAEQISDPAAKRRAFEILMWGMLHPSMAPPETLAQNIAIFEKSNFPEEWKRPLRESIAK